MNEEEAQAALEDYAATINVGPKVMTAQLRECEKHWETHVVSESEGKFRGEIRSYSFGPNPPLTGDMRDTWTLCAVNKNSEIVGYDYFAPWEDVDFAVDPMSDYAADVAKGLLTLSRAKQYIREIYYHQAPDELRGWLDAGRYSLKDLKRDNGVPKWGDQ